MSPDSLTTVTEKNSFRNLFHLQGMRLYLNGVNNVRRTVFSMSSARLKVLTLNLAAVSVAKSKLSFEPFSFEPGRRSYLQASMD